MCVCRHTDKATAFVADGAAVSCRHPLSRGSHKTTTTFRCCCRRSYFFHADALAYVQRTRTPPLFTADCPRAFPADRKTPWKGSRRWAVWKRGQTRHVWAVCRSGRAHAYAKEHGYACIQVCRGPGRSRESTVFSPLRPCGVRC